MDGICAAFITRRLGFTVRPWRDGEGCNAKVWHSRRRGGGRRRTDCGRSLGSARCRLSHADVSAWAKSARYGPRARLRDIHVIAACPPSPSAAVYVPRRAALPRHFHRLRPPLSGGLVPGPQLRNPTLWPPTPRAHHRVGSPRPARRSVYQRGLVDACCEDARPAPFAVGAAPSDHEVRAVPPCQQRSALGIHVDGRPVIASVSAGCRTRGCQRPAGVIRRVNCDPRGTVGHRRAGRAPPLRSRRRRRPPSAAPRRRGAAGLPTFRPECGDGVSACAPVCPRLYSRSTRPASSMPTSLTNAESGTTSSARVHSAAAPSR